MARITVRPFDTTIDTAPKETLYEALARAGIYLDASCDGQGICGECRVRVEDPENVPPTPHETISDSEAKQGIRLACQLVPEQDMVVEVLSALSEDDSYLILEGDSFSGKERRRQKSRSSAVCHSAVRVKGENRRYQMAYQDGSPQPLAVWSDDFSPKGLAVDIGTTTVVASLVCLASGKELSTASALNPQIKTGHDVMTRIQKGSEAEGLQELKSLVEERIMRLAADVCRDAGADGREIVDMVIGGNTTMLELAAGVNPEPLGHMPFDVTLEGGKVYEAGMFVKDFINPAAKVYVPPLAHAFVGTDITAGLLACTGFFEEDTRVLFVDIGTNAELALNLGERTLVTSTAAGPAFEGMGISSGKRAGIGAVEAVETDGESLRISTIGNTPVQGICGSGIFDLVACLLQLGVVEPSGRMIRPSETDGLPPAIASAVCEIDEQPAFQYGEGVYFTQKDIRQVQLAKSPVRTAIDIFMKECAASLERVVLSGGFGHTLRPESLVRIGILPEELSEKVYFAGNTSLSGCRYLLTDVGRRRFLEEKLSAVEHLSLAERPDFMEAFIENSEFPVG